MKSKTKQLTLCSLFATLTAILSQISIPLPFTPVPINLATLSVLLAGAILGKKGGAISQIVYALLGAVGLPVYANFLSGIGILIGPTGGYIIGYIIAAFVVGIIVEKSEKNLKTYLLSMCLGIIACYILGTAWFMYVTNNNLISALTLCVLPFIPGDIIKIIFGACIANRLKKIRI